MMKVLDKESFSVAAKDMLDKYLLDDMIIMRWNIDRYRTLFTLYGQTICDHLVTTLCTYLMESYDSTHTIIGRIAEDSIVLCTKKNPSEYQDKINRAAAIMNQLNIGSLISFSVGVYNIANREIEIMEMCDLAAIPIDDLRSSYANQYGYYDATIMDSKQIDQEIMLEMDDALRNEEFVIFLQPVVSISEDHVVSAEALVRWMHPKRGLIFPGLFIPLFEKNGFITKMDYYVWERVCQYQRGRCDRGLAEIPISMNISRRSVNDEDIATLIHELVQKYRLDPSLIRLEITESAYMDDARLLIDTVNRLKAYGHLVLMDDFGSGYSSLNMLKDLEVDILKIDMKFMECFDTSSRAGNIITSIMRMANWLGMQVIAEGVETANSVIFLRGIGCNYMQDYFYSKPLPIPEFEEFVAEKLVHAVDAQVVQMNINAFDDFFNGNIAFTRLFNNAVGGLAIFEFKQNRIEILRVNDIFYQMLGYDSSDLSTMGKNVQNLVFLADRECVTESCKHCVEDQKTQDSVLRVYNKGGNIIWLNVKFQFLGRSGEDALMSMSATDVTKLKRLEVQEQVKRYTSVIMGLCEEIIVINLEEQTAMVVNSKYNRRVLDKKIDYLQFLDETVDGFEPKEREKVLSFLEPKKIQSYNYQATIAPTLEVEIASLELAVEWVRLVLLQIDEFNYLICSEDISKQKEVEVLTKKQLSNTKEQLSRMLTHSTSKQNTILIVDDEPINRSILRKYLENKYQILEAVEGKQAMEMIKAHRDQLCLILLDIYMPGMNGYEVLQEVESDPSLRHIPIIVVSSTGEKAAESKVLKLGAMELLKKPFNHDVICQRVDNTIKLCQISANIAINDVVINEVPCNLAVCAISDKIQISFMSRWMTEKVFGVNTEAVFAKYGNDAIDFIYEDDRERVKAEIMKAVSNHSIFDTELRLLGPNGLCSRFQAIGKFAYQEDNQAFYYFAFNKLDNWKYVDINQKQEKSK